MTAFDKNQAILPFNIQAYSYTQFSYTFVSAGWR